MARSLDTRRRLPRPSTSPRTTRSRAIVARVRRRFVDEELLPPSPLGEFDNVNKLPTAAAAAGARRAPRERVQRALWHARTRRARAQRAAQRECSAGTLPLRSQAAHSSARRCLRRLSGCCDGLQQELPPAGTAAAVAAVSSSRASAPGRLNARSIFGSGALRPLVPALRLQPVFGNRSS